MACNSENTIESHICKAVPADVAFVRSCSEAAYTIYVDRIGKRPAPMVADFEKQIADGQVEILSLKTRRVGFLVWRYQSDHLFLENAAILPDQQGKGLFRAAFSYLEATAVEQSKPAIVLYTNAMMTENLALYTHLGFKEIERRKEDGFSRVYFRKDLTPVTTN